MKRLFEYVMKVWNDDSEVYAERKRVLCEMLCLGSVFLVCLLFVAVPIGRTILRWITYFFVGSTGVFALFMCTTDIVSFTRAYKRHCKFEDAGISEDKAENIRVELCKVEGDDGFSAEDFNSQRHIAYFVDCSALASYANSLYGCFLSQRFDPKYIKLDEDAVFYTTQKELDKLQDSETNQNIPGSPYPGYTGYIRTYVRLVPDIPKESLLCERESGLADTPTTDDEMNVALALYVQNSEMMNVIMISESQEVHELANYNCIKSKKPFSEG